MLRRRRVLIPGGIALLVVIALLLSWVFGAFTGGGPAPLSAAQIQLSKASYSSIGEGTLRGSLKPGTKASPLMAVVGNDFAAGIGEDLKSAFPEQLGPDIGYRVAVSASIGAGYVNKGEDGFGPYSTLLSNLDLPRLQPSIVLVQGGYNDTGADPFALSAAVVSLIQTIHQQAPDATLVVMGTFDDNIVGPLSPAVEAANSTILDAARSVSPKPAIIDPLTDEWQFQRDADGLHPTAAGDQVIAAYIATALQKDGIVPASQVHLPALSLSATTEGPQIPAGISIPAGNQPVLLVIGASFAAGVGVGLNPQLAWPGILGQRINYRVVVSADPGAGFVNPGDGGLGPFSFLLAQVNVAALKPALVLIQGGHNDAGINATDEKMAVSSLFETIRQEAPQARIGLLGFFDTSRIGPAPLGILNTDAAIVSAARSAVPNLLVFDPLTSHWVFPRIRDHLHPTPAGHKKIAGYVAGGLLRDGVIQQIY
ncbi:MAG TPA: SGNH/GDSL hydrolase family protein [Acidimicrobiales bacterium]|nr:SGNH/GDSL hydrolase family protein [Acidimicrobiales bacterium]